MGSKQSSRLEGNFNETGSVQMSNEQERERFIPFDRNNVVNDTSTEANIAQSEFKTKPAIHGSARRN
jgi:hypothetical protein